MGDLDRITTRETAPEVITAQIAPLLGRRVNNADATPARFRGRAPDGGRGRFMLHRAPRFAMHNPTTRDTGEIHVYGRDLHGLRRKTWAPDGRVSLLVSPKYINC